MSGHSEFEPLIVGAFTLSKGRAYALAELCKRISFTDARNNAASDSEAHSMLAAMDSVRSALERAGVSVR